MPQQAEIESDRASTSSSANGSSSSCEERERLKNPRSNPNYLKATTSSEKKKMDFRVSNLTDSESSTISYDKNKPVLRNMKSKINPSFKRNTSMKTLRILMSKPNRGSQDMSCPRVPEGEGVIKATCSSTLKDSKLPLIELEPEERDSEKISTLRVCTYTYCSLHGHHNHSPTPPLKRLLSKRRRYSKTQKGIRVKTQSSSRENSSNDSIKDTRTRKLVLSEDSKGREKGKIFKVVSGKSKVKVAKGDESMSQPKGDNELAKNNELGDGKKKPMSMWYLIHQQMLSGLAEGRENQETEVQKTGNENKETGNQEMDMENKETGNREMGTEITETGNQGLEIQKRHAVKMVREAIEKILLPEVPDQSPDNMSTCSDAPSVEELLEERNTCQDPQQGGNAKNKVPKCWSNLKKMILLKRFVKELEKVRKINPRKSRFLSVGPYQEGERVPLRHKGDTKRSAEEWMLDYALQQAVSELAPTQKRKVDLLIKAYETMITPLDGEPCPLSFPRFKGIRNEGNHIADDVGEDFVDEENKNSSTVSDESNVLAEGKLNQWRRKDESNFSEQSQEVDDVISDRIEDGTVESLVASSFSDCSTVKQLIKSEEVENEDVDSLEMMVTLNDQEFSLSESNCTKLEVDEVPLTSDQKHGPTIDSKTENRLRACNSKFTKPKNTSMWHLIHQQMVAGLHDEGKVKENENQNEDEEGAVAAGTGSECDDMESQEVELRKVFAIKMVREAIEKILLPEVQDQSSDDLSTTSETVSEQELIEKKQDEDWGSQIFNSFSSAKEDPPHYSTNKLMYDLSLTQEGVASGPAQEPKSELEKKELKREQKAEKQAPKRWSNLKKWIVLQRFVKELEKVKDFNPRKPQLLQLKLDPEGQVVRLRNQMTNEKRNEEEWMLDYALRKVVSELEPKQKKKVELLVKAFETVVPPTEEMKSPVTFSKPKISEVARLKNIFTPKIDGGNNNSAITVEKSDVVSRSSLRDTKLDGLGTDTAGKSIPSEGNENKIIGLKGFGKLTNKSESDKQKHMKMWHLLCQHVVSDVAVKIENHHPYGEDNNVASHEYSTIDKGRVDDNRTVEFSKSHAVQLVRDAIEEILAPDIQDDSSDTLSIASDISQDQELLEEKKPRNWDKLKKMILLKRSIKALEKARRLNPRAPCHIPLESGQEEEKAKLKHQFSDERKKAEDWMLDYAVQHIVTKLTPARKLRVSMLVEAFEAVVPFPQF